MADFSTLMQAQAAAQTKMADGTYVEAHGEVTVLGAPAMRVLNPVTTTGGGDWSSTVTAP